MMIQTKQIRLQNGDGSRKTVQKTLPAAKKTIVKPAARNAVDESRPHITDDTSSPKTGAAKTAGASVTGFFGKLTEAARKANAEKGAAAIRAAATPAGKTNSSGTQTGGTQTGGTQTGGSGTGGTQTAAAETAPVTFESLLRDMLERYRPATVALSPLDENELHDMIEAWLRPAYEQAIARRREQTDRSNAELDADAWARGMGASTYVTDVKERAFRGEARDVGDLESEYASALAGHLLDAWKSRQEQQIEVDRFNAEQQNLAREHAADTALKLYQTYLNAMQTGGAVQTTASGGGRSGADAASAAKKVQKSVNKAASAFVKAAQQKAKAQADAAIDLKTAANMIARLTPQQRKDLYAGKGAFVRQHGEILNGIGADAFARLMKQFPAA